MNRDITLTAEQLPGILNMIADEESRVMKDWSDWMLDPQVFQQIQERWGPLEVDMFASRLTTKLDRFFSWRPDPEAEALDAFSQDWTNLQGRGYANPPRNLVGRAEFSNKKITLVLIAPVWKSQPWYPTLQGLLMDFSRLLPLRRDLIILTHAEYMPGMAPQLAAWLISGDATRTRKFQRRAQSCSWLPEGKNHHVHMTHSLGSGWTGVMNRTLIPFLDL